MRFKWTDHCLCQGHPNWWWKWEMQKCSLWFLEHTWCSVPHQVFPCVANCICLLCGSLRTCTSALNFTFLPCMFFQTISIYHQFPAVLKHFLKPWLFIFMCCYLYSFICLQLAVDLDLLEEFWQQLRFPLWTQGFREC